MNNRSGMALSNYLELIWYRSIAELKAEVARAYLGFIWWFLEPVLLMAVFYFIFATGLRGRGAEYAPFLRCGLVAFKWCTSSVNRASQWERGNLGIIQQVYVPKIVFMLTGLLNNFFKFIIILFMLGLFLSVYGNTPSIFWVAIPVLLISEFLL
ncbi:MAG: ABC transporter permease, partial [Gammaproteobacteria bacterium]